MLEKEKKPTILCVDDDPMSLALLQAILAPRGYEVIPVESGQDALEKAASAAPDLILLDIMMPKMSGFEVLQKLRVDEKTRLIPVVMVTALKETEDRVTALEAGCDDFISKPFDKIELLARVKSLLKISYYRRKLDEREKFKAVLDETSDGIAVCSSDWIIKDSNVSILKYLNIADQANVNLVKTIFKNYSVSIPREELIDLTVAHKTFDIVREETETTKALYLEANLDVVSNPAGETTDTVFTLRDVTAARREEFLKQDFLSLISHKLLTPVTVIGESVSVLREGLLGPLNEKQKEFVERLLNKFSQLKALIDRLIEFTKISSQTFDLSKELIGLKSYLPQVVDSVVKQNKDKKIDVNVSFEDENAVVNLSKASLDLIMKNLIENAIKFGDKEIVKIDIAIKAKPENIEVSVSDNGPGIPPEEQGKIFERFYQIEKYFTGNVEGVGLGLAITKYLVSAYGGKITLESAVGKGAKFILTLPK